MGLGSAFDFSLAEARDRNRTLVRQKLADGIDPLVTKQAERAAKLAAAAKAVTFDECAKQYCDFPASQRRNAADVSTPTT